MDEVQRPEVLLTYCGRPREGRLDGAVQRNPLVGIGLLRMTPPEDGHNDDVILDSRDLGAKVKGVKCSVALDDSDLSDAMTVLEGVQKTEVEFLGTYFGGSCDEGGHDSADHGSDATHHGQPCDHPGILRGQICR